MSLHRPVAVQGTLSGVGGPGGGRGRGLSVLGRGSPHPDTVIIGGGDQDLKTRRK